MALSRILVPLDGSSFAESAYLNALTIAEVTGSHITLLRVLDTRSQRESAPNTLEWRLHKAEAHQYLNQMVETGLRHTDQRVGIDAVLAEGKPAERIIQVIHDHQVDLLVISAYGSSGQSAFPFGGTAHKILIKANVPYLAIRSSDHTDRPPRYQRILVPLDGSRKAEIAINIARKLDQHHQAEIVLLHVIAIPAMTRKRPLTEHEQLLRDELVECNRMSARTYIEETSKHLALHHNVRIRLEAAINPAQRIAEVAAEEHAELMILTAYGGAELNGWSRESICQSLLAATDTPVLVLQDDMRLTSNGPSPNTNGHNKPY